MVKRPIEPLDPVGSRRSSARVWRRLWLSGDDRHADCYGWRPPTNFYESKVGGTVQIEVAGLKEGGYRVAFAEGRLTVVGRREVGQGDDLVACHRMEIASGRFMTRIDVPWPVRVEAIQIEYADGFLEVRLPREGAAEPPQSRIEGNDA